MTLHWFRIDQSATYLCRGNKLGWRRNLFMRLTQFFFLDDAMIEEDRLSLKFRNRFNPSLFPILTCWYWLFYFLLLMLFVFLHYGWKGICGGRLLLVIGEGSTVLSNSLLKVHFFGSHMAYPQFNFFKSFNGILQCKFNRIFLKSRAGQNQKKTFNSKPLVFNLWGNNFYCTF